jgi:hypothetical protein
MEDVSTTPACTYHATTSSAAKAVYSASTSDTSLEVVNIGVEELPAQHQGCVPQAALPALRHLHRPLTWMVCRAGSAPVVPLEAAASWGKVRSRRESCTTTSCPSAVSCSKRCSVEHTAAATCDIPPVAAAAAAASAALAAAR